MRAILRKAKFKIVCIGILGNPNRSILIESLSFPCGTNRWITFEAAEGEEIERVLGEMLTVLDAMRTKP